MSDSPPPMVKPAQNNVSMCFSNDILSPLLKEPLKNGWRREVVYRSIVDSEKRNNTCDIYYFTPDGKKLRSRPEVLKYLNGSNSCFSMKHFSFYKEPIGMDDDQEICRYARTKPIWCEDKGEQPKKNSKKKNIVKVKNSSPKHCHRESENNVATTTPKITKKRSRDDEIVPCNQIDDEHQNKQRRFSIRKRIPTKKLQESTIKITRSKQPPTAPATSHDSIPLPINLDDESSPACSVHDCKGEDTESESSDEKEKKVESPVQQTPPVSSRLSATAAPFPETLPLNSPLIGLLPVGTTLVLSDPSTLRIIPPCTTSAIVKEIENPHPEFIPSPPSSVENCVVADSSKTSFRKSGKSKKIQITTSCATSTTVKEIKNSHPEFIPSPPSSVENCVLADSPKTSFRKPGISKKIQIATSCIISTPVKETKNSHPELIPSSPSSVENSVVADSSKTLFRKPSESKKIQIAALSPVNDRKLRSNKTAATATISAPKASPPSDGFAVPPNPSDYRNQRLIPEFGMLGNQNPSYWISIGKAIIEEGLQKALRSNTSATVGDNPISVTQKVRGVKKAAAPPVPMTCEEFFALRKQKREQQLKQQLKQPQIVVITSTRISVKKSN